MSDKIKILFINLGGIGDEILFLPTICAVRKKFQDAEITLCTEHRSRAIRDLTDCFDKLYTIKQNKNRYCELLKLIIFAQFQQYDYVISSGSNSLIPLLLWLTGAKKRIGFEGSKFQKLLTTAVKLDNQRYAAEMYFELVKELTHKDFSAPRITIKEEQSIIENSVLIHPGVSAMSRNKSIIKTFNGKIWAEIIDKLLEKGKKVILAGGPDDKQVYDEIILNLKHIDNNNFLDYYGKTKNIMDLAKLINNTQILLCSDSAPMHIGVALDKRVAAIFGPTDEKKLIPQKDNFMVIKNTNCSCRPCLWDKRQTTCAELKCIQIDIENIINCLIN